MSGGQSNSEHLFAIETCQHHHDLRCVRFLSEILRVAGEGDTRIIDCAFLYGCSDDGINIPRHGGRECRIEHVQYGFAVAGIKLSGDRCYRKWAVENSKLARMIFPAGWRGHTLHRVLGRQNARQ